MPGNAAIPAVDARRNLVAREAGRRIVELVKTDIVLSKILTREAFENAIRVNAGIGGSTNAVVHLIAIARRIGVKLALDDWDRLGRGVHCLVDIMPSGRFLMEDFFEAGGLPVVIRELGEARPAARERADGERAHDRRQHARRAMLEARRRAHVRRSVQARCRHRGAARQSRARRRHASSRRPRRRT